MIPASKVAMVGLHAEGVLPDEFINPFGLVVPWQMVPSAALGNPEACERLALTQEKIHRVAGLEPAVIVMNPAFAINLEYFVLVMVLREKGLYLNRRICPEVFVSLGFGQTDNHSICVREDSADIQIVVVPCIIIPELGCTVVPRFETEGAPLFETDALEDTIQDRAEYPAISHIVNIQNLQRVAHRRIFVERVGPFEDFIEMIEPGFIAGQIFPYRQGKVVVFFND